MSYTFTSTVTKGRVKGGPMEAAKDADGNYILFHPSKRRNKKVYAEDYVLTRSAEDAKRLIEEEGFSMRMRPLGTSDHNLVMGSRIVITPTG